MAAKKKLPPDVLEYFKRQGSKGGKESAKIRESWPDEKKSAAGKKAAEARWKRQSDAQRIADAGIVP